MRRWILLMALLALPASAQDLLIRNATVHTMGAGGVLEGQDLLVRDGRVARIGTGIDGADATLIDAAGRPVTPALFAGLSEVGLREVSGVSESVDAALGLADAQDRFRPEFDVSTAYNPHSTLIPVARVEGFGFTALAARRQASILAGRGRIARLDGGYAPFLGAPILYVDIGGDATPASGGSRAAQWMLAQQTVREIDRSDFRPGDLLTETGRQVLRDFRRRGVVVFDVDRASDIWQAIEFARDRRFELVIAGGAEAWMVADQLAATNTPVLLDPLDNLPGSFDQLGARLDNARLLHEAGVEIAFTLRTRQDSHNVRKLRQAAGNAVRAGLPWDAALAALTASPARIFGVDEELGRIEPGLRADLVIWSGDPLEVTSAADQVILDGVAVDMVSRQTRLRDRYLREPGDLPRAYLR